MTMPWRRALLSGIALTTLAAPAAHATDRSTQAALDALQEQINQLQQQIQDLKASQASNQAETKKALDDQAKVVTLTDGRPTFKKGDFSASLRGIVQFDGAYYSGDHAPGGQDLSSGTNFRRARIGIDGQLGAGWDYSFIYDFGGSGVEGTAISAAWIQYSGFKPFAVRVGAFAPNANIEDAAGATDTIFLERASAVEVARGLAGGDGRSAVQIAAAGDRYLASVAYTGGRAGAAASFDEQQAVLGRVAGVLYSTQDAKFVLGANGSYIFKVADAAADPNGAPATVTFSNAPELRVDNTSLVTSGALANVSTVSQWAVDAGAQYKNLYAEGGYYTYKASRSGPLPDAEFSGYYGSLSYVITGERRRYHAGSASFRAPKVAHPFAMGPDGGWGAWEAAIRYSVLDLNDDERSLTGVRGSEQSILTLGLNWYPNNNVRFALNYLLIDIDRLSGTAPNFTDIGQKAQAFALRTQYAF